jgi:outer membrane protein OmpA-like peptidoglycan-associated protein
MRNSICCAALLLALLGGCGTFRPAGTGSASGTGGAAATRPSLADEQRRLAELFRDTPVAFTMQADGSLRVTVPLRYSFDKSRYVVKPPLGKVLEHVARSQRGEVTRFVVAAPADPHTKGLKLATERATSTRDYLVGHGVDAWRFTVSALGSGDAVVIVVADVAAQ